MQKIFSLVITSMMLFSHVQAMQLVKKICDKQVPRMWFNMRFNPQNITSLSNTSYTNQRQEQNKKKDMKDALHIVLAFVALNGGLIIANQGLDHEASSFLKPIQTAKIFAKAQINNNSQDVWGRTPLMLAIRSHQSVAIIKKLLATKPDLSIKDNRGKSVYDYIDLEIGIMSSLRTDKEVHGEELQKLIDAQQKKRDDLSEIKQLVENYRKEIENR